MIGKLNILHLAIVLGAAGCFLLARSEATGRSMRPLQIFATPSLALLTALLLLFFALTRLLSKEIAGGLLIVGFAVGAVRGSRIAIVVDQLWGRVRLRNGRYTVWVAMALMLAVGLEVSNALMGGIAFPYRIIPSTVAALCAGLLFGCAVAVAIRISTAPNDKHR